MAKFFAGVVAGLAFVASSSMTSASPITSQPPALEASGNVTLVFIGYDAADTSFLTEAGSSANIFCNYSRRKLLGHAFGHHRQSRHAIWSSRLGVA